MPAYIDNRPSRINQSLEKSDIADGCAPLSMECASANIYLYKNHWETHDVRTKPDNSPEGK
jgi:hypothetical protein